MSTRFDKFCVLNANGTGQHESEDDEEYDEEEDQEEDWDDPGTYAHCSDWEDHPEECMTCADDDCPKNTGW